MSEFLKAAWYEKQGAARDALIVGEMNEPQPLAGEVRIRVAFSGINPGDVKKRQNAFASGCHIHVSFRTAMVRGLLMRRAKEYRGNGLGGVYGATALNRTVLSALLPSTRWFL